MRLITASDVTAYKRDTWGLDPALQTLQGAGRRAILEHTRERLSRLGVTLTAKAKPWWVPKTDRARRVYMMIFPVLYLGNTHGARSDWSVARTLAHEAVHARRQLSRRYWTGHDRPIRATNAVRRVVRRWVLAYGLDRRRRLREELIACRESVRVYRAQHPGDDEGATKLAKAYVRNLRAYFGVKPSHSLFTQRCLRVVLEPWRGV